MKKYIIVFIIISVIIFVNTLTFKNIYRNSSGSFFHDQLRKNWKNSDTLSVKQQIAELNNQSLDDLSFFLRVQAISDVTKFYYGNIDLDSNAHNWIITNSINRKRIVRQNIATVYNLYIDSCLGMNKKLTYEESLPIQDMYWADSEKLNQQTILKIKMELDKLCH
jgi:hypothetical protein